MWPSLDSNLRPLDLQSDALPTALWRRVHQHLSRFVNPFMPCFPLNGAFANSIDPDQMPQNEALSTGISVKYGNSKTNQKSLLFEMDWSKDMVEESTRYKWVKS